MFVNSAKFLPVANMSVSSANNIQDILLDTLQMSLIYSRNNNGPTIDICGTP